MNIFAAIPFDGPFNLIFRYLIKDPLEARGHLVTRADDNPENQNIYKEIIQGIKNAELIIADLTGGNSNVYYELGIAHTLLKPTIQIIQDIHDIRFDLRPYQTILYSLKPGKLSELTEELLTIIGNDSYLFANPVNDYLDSNHRKPIRISQTTSGSFGNAEVDSDDSDYGLLDAVRDSEEVGNELALLNDEVLRIVRSIRQTTKQVVNEWEELESEPSQPRINDKALRLFQQFAADLDKYSSNLQEKIPEVRKSWIKFDQAHGFITLSNEIEDQDLLELSQFGLDHLIGLQYKVITNANSMQELRDTHNGLLGVSRTANHALQNSITTLNQLIDVYRLGGSVLSRMIGLTGDMINRYQVNNPDNSGNPTPNFP